MTPQRVSDKVGRFKANSIFNAVSDRSTYMHRPGIIPRMWQFIRLYLVSLTLIGIFIWTILEVYVFGVGPVPQQPPPGYVEERLETRLQWHSGNINRIKKSRGGKPCDENIPEGFDPRFKQSCLEKVELQVAIDDPDFKELFVDKPVSGNTHVIKNLEPGHTYYWRLMQGGKPSATYSFETAPQAVNF